MFRRARSPRQHASNDGGGRGSRQGVAGEHRPPVHLVWIAPKTSGSSAITGYEICYGTSAAAAATCASSETVPTVIDATVAGLTNGTTYYFAVRAKNAR